MLCVTAAEKRGLTESNIHSDFTISGRAEFAELTTEADKVIQFK
jgi:sulfur relay (sulfurtransferase) complex TusBCD TusD component (DsrE family)